MKTILAAVDGSPIALHAFASLLQLIEGCEPRPAIHVASVAEHVRLPAGLTKAPPGVPDLIASEAQTAIAVAQEFADQRGFAIKTEVLHGHPATELLAYAGRVGAEIIAVGTRGRGGLERAVLGSTSDELVRTATIPVLVVRARQPR